jgi:DNA-binding IclR family transcriptional regulator
MSQQAEDMSTAHADGVEASGSRSVLGRLVDILDAFDEMNQALTLNELTLRTGLPKSTVHRFAEQLRAVGWLERELSGYRVGMRLFEVGRLATRRSRLCEPALPHLQELALKTGLAAQLAILDDTEVVYLQCIRTGEVHIPTREGGRMPAYCTGLGKAMLAFDEAASADVLSHDLERRTRNTIHSADTLERELCEIRERGVAFDRQESFDGLACVAAPLRSLGRAIGAISVAGPVELVEPKVLAPYVQQVAAAIWADRFDTCRSR